MNFRISATNPPKYVVICCASKYGIASDKLSIRFESTVCVRRIDWNEHINWQQQRQHWPIISFIVMPGNCASFQKTSLRLSISSLCGAAHDKHIWSIPNHEQRTTVNQFDNHLMRWLAALDSCQLRHDIFIVILHIITNYACAPNYFALQWIGDDDATCGRNATNEKLNINRSDRENFDGW